MKKLVILRLLALPLIGSIAAIACQISGPLSTPTLSPSTPTLNSVATSLPPTSIPTLDPFSVLPPGTLPPGTNIVLTQVADPDDDGQEEGIVLYAGADQDYSEGYGLVVKSDSTVYHLGGEEPTVLFVTDTAPNPVEVEVYDHNGDGRPEIVVTGQIGMGPAVVHVFRWDGSRYPALLNLIGEDGVLVEEGGRVTARSNLSEAGYFIAKTAAWDGSAYRVRSHYGLLVALDDCLALERSPSCAVVAFYELLSEGDTATAHMLLAEEMQVQIAPDELPERFGHLLTGLEEELSQGDTGTVRVKVASEGVERNGTWSLRLEQGQWVLVDF